VVSGSSNFCDIQVTDYEAGAGVATTD